MKLRGSAIALGLTLAVVTAAAASAATQSASHPVSHGGHARGGHGTRPGGTRIRTAPAVSPRVIYIDVPAVANPAPYVDPNACQDSGIGCTAAQACVYWGECDATSFAQSTAATATDTTATDPAATDPPAAN
jgi:hypothetical protein